MQLTQKLGAAYHGSCSFFKRSPIWIYFSVVILFCELCIKLMLYGFALDTGYIYVPLFSVAAGIVCSLIASIWHGRALLRATRIITFIICFYFCFQLVYFRTIKSFFVFITLIMAGDVTEFWRETLISIGKNSPCILLLSLPFFALMVFGKKRFATPKSTAKQRIRAGITAASVQLLALLLITCSSGGDFSDYYYYRSSLSTSDTVKRFGIVTTARMDIQQLIFGKPHEDIDNPYKNDDVDEMLAVGSTAATTKTTKATPATTTEKLPDKKDIYNIMDIDFDSLIANEKDKEIKEMHEYFSSKTVTKKNKYTGMFKGKNLIMLTLEGFSDKVIDPQLTPTLYKMYTQGFQFENYYNSLWGGSTATGEYAELTGNFYTSANCLELSSTTTQPFTMAHLLSGSGYSSYAYHNNTYTYYGRNLSHPNFGYAFRAVGNGLDELDSSWPRSDNQMAQQTVDDYINSDKPFNAYYMTVSGHGNYSWSGNAMSTKNKARVQNLDCSEKLKSYYACQLEVEDMLTTLVDKLEKAGKLNDTVFVMNADHYPYLLDDEDLADLYNLNEDGIRLNFDLYRNGLIIWSAGMKQPVKVTTPCSAIDIIPTVANLFGVEFDSRLLMGTDVMSGIDPIVILNCLGSGGSWHWISSNGSYSTITNKFTKSENSLLSEEKISSYVATINKIVQSKHKYTIAMLDRDYYSYIFTDYQNPELATFTTTTTTATSSDTSGISVTSATPSITATTKKR